jgi:dipeptidyl aminopeptidase/acylaminoacyl peptidase
MKRMIIPAFLGTALTLCAPASGQDGDAIRPFTAEDVFALEWADDPQVAPDGRTLLYMRRGHDIMTDRATSALWLVDLASGEQQPLLLAEGGPRSARWSPDGERIAFLARGKGGKTELRVLYVGTGREAVLGSFQDAPSDITWAPDGQSIAFIGEVAGEPETLVKAPKKPDGAEWAEAPKVIDQARYRSDGGGFMKLAYDHVFVIPADGGTARQLTEGDYNHEGPLSFTPDGESLIFAANRHENWQLETIESDIFSVDLASGELTQITSEPGAEENPILSPDGERIAYIRRPNEPEPFIIGELTVMDLDGDNPRSLTADLDRRVHDPQWMSDSELAFAYDDRGERHVAVTDLNGNREVRAEGIGGTTIGRPYISGSFDAGSKGTIAYTKGSALRPADLYVQRSGLLPGSRSETQLTALNEDLLSHRDLGEVRGFTVASSFDGEEIQGWIMTPPGYEEGETYPLILEIHGGPHLAYGPHFSAELQRMAAEGYVVVYDNHRGSSSYGSEFANLLKYKYSSEEDFADHMSAVDWAIENGYADEDNLFIAGGSAGGIATAYAVGLTDRFNAAVAAKPVINWISKTLTADSYIGQIRHQFPGYPWEEFEHYWKRSPLSLVGNVTTPTMLITGEEDYRTPISETEQFYQALQLKGVPSVMVRIPGSSHGIASRPSRLNAKTDYTLAWFEKYRMDEEGSEASSGN